MGITGTFLDEISHDIPHQNWGVKEWDMDFRAMKSIGIDTVIMIRCGYKKWITYPSNVLTNNENCYVPSIDLVEMFLDLSEKYDMDFYFGLYDSGKYWVQNDWVNEIDINKRVIEEVWKIYRHKPAFKGWYVSQETSRKSESIINIYNELGGFCKEISGGLNILISPYIDGRKALISSHSELEKKNFVTPQQHEKEWSGILDGIKENIDIVAFQDGQVEFDELSDFLAVNKNIADKYGLASWSNTESFDRDMPIKFLPIKWEKLLYKIEAARQSGVEKIITFEFSHFMSPNSSYLQATHLFERYKEYSTH